MATDDWYYARPNVARDYLLEFQSRGAKALTLFAGRGTGKTAFLQRDLAPIADKHDRMPVYVDVWAVRTDPALGIANSLKMAVQNRERRKPGKRELSAINVSVLGVGAGITAAHKPEPDEPSNDVARIGFWADRLVQVAGDRKVMLLLDEVQELGKHKDGVAVASALRASFQTHYDRFEPVFTGSERDQLLQMFRTSKAPLFQYGDEIQLPKLDRGFTEFVATKFRQGSGLQLDIDQLESAFDALGRKPGSLIDLTRGMLRSHSADLTTALATALERQQIDHEREMALAQLGPLDRMVLAIAAHERPLYSDDALEQYAQQLGVDNVSSGSVQKSIERLRGEQLIYQPSRGVYRVNDAALAAQLRERTPQLAVDGTPQLMSATDAVIVPAALSAPPKSKVEPKAPERDKSYVGRVVDMPGKTVVQNVDGDLVEHQLSDMASGKYQLLQAGILVKITYKGGLWSISEPKQQEKPRSKGR